MKNAIDRAEELRLDAALGEVSGAKPADDLLERTLAGLDTPPEDLASAPARRAAPRRWRPSLVGCCSSLDKMPTGPGSLRARR